MSQKRFRLPALLRHPGHTGDSNPSTPRTKSRRRLGGGGKKKRILVLDDEPDIVTYLVTLLRDNGYETLSAYNGREGIDMAWAENPDLVTLDISMPERSGMLFYRELKKDPDLKRIPVVIVTAVTDDSGDPYPYRDALVNGQSLPAPDGYLTKPIDRDEFLTTIRKLLS